MRKVEGPTCLTCGRRLRSERRCDGCKVSAGIATWSMAHPASGPLASREERVAWNDERRKAWRAIRLAAWTVTGRVGFKGNGYFCSRTCAFHFAVARAALDSQE